MRCRNWTICLLIGFQVNIIKHLGLKTLKHLLIRKNIHKSEACDCTIIAVKHDCSRTWHYSAGCVFGTSSVAIFALLH